MVISADRRQGCPVKERLFDTRDRLSAKATRGLATSAIGTKSVALPISKDAADTGQGLAVLFASLVMTVSLAASEDARFHLLESQLRVADQARAAPASTTCLTLYPKVAPPAPAAMATPAPDVSIKKSLADAFSGRGRATACVYGASGVRRQDPRFGMRQITLELATPLASPGPLRLMLRTVVERFAMGRNNAEVYAGISY